MDLLRLVTILAPLVIIGALNWAGTRLWLHRERARTAGLRSEIAAQVRLATSIDAATIHRSGGWFPLRGPRKLIVGTDAFIFSAPNALRELVVRGSECSIAFSQAPSRVIKRDWIVITGQSRGRRVQFVISHRNPMDVWQALAATGAATGVTAGLSA